MKADALINELESRVKPLLKGYQSDLEIDREIIEKNPGTPFVHITRENGTHIRALLSPSDISWPKPGERVPYFFGRATRERIIENEVEGKMHALLHLEPVLVLYYDGYKLKKITVKRAIEILRQWKNAVLTAWKKGE